MRIPNAVHEAHPWRIHEIVPDFTLEDVWALPTDGDAGDFEALVDVMANLEFPSSSSPLTRVLWSTRDLLGRRCGLGRISVPIDGTVDATGRMPIPGTNETSLADRLSDDLRDTAAADLDDTPFVPLYRIVDEYAAELSNRTVHAVLHLAWADQGDGRYRGQMAVYVKPRGLFGTAYMAFIKPFRYAIVYPALMRHIERAWAARTIGPGARSSGTIGPGARSSGTIRPGARSSGEAGEATR
jgi:Protein of unknown function (DUF2867)